MNDKNYFVNKMEQYLLANNVTIIKNAEVVKINGKDKATSVDLIRFNKKYRINGDQFLIATPAINLYYLIKQILHFLIIGDQ